MKSICFIILILFQLSVADNKGNLRRNLETTESDREDFRPHKISSSLNLGNQTRLDESSDFVESPVQKAPR